MKFVQQKARLGETCGMEVMDRQLQVLLDRVTIAPVTAKKEKRDRAAASQQAVEVDLPIASDGIAISIKEILEQVESLLIQICQTTGFGSLTVECDRKRQKIQVIIKAGIHFRYVISDEDVAKWVSRKSSQCD